MNDLPPSMALAALDVESLHRSLSDPIMATMEFLNEVSARFPDATSFASGRPYEDFFDIEKVFDRIRLFAAHLECTGGMSRAEVERVLFQYGRTKGIVHQFIARNLQVDEGMDVDPESIMVTVGCQEAMFLVLRALRADERDVVLAAAPTYVGFSGAARLVDLPVYPVRSTARGLDTDDLVSRVRALRAAGLRPRACYVMPDCSNPSGVTMDVSARAELLAVAESADLLLIEDNPYGLFHVYDERPPTLKALDSRRGVIYLGSFAKTAFPGARVGYVIADQPVARPDGSTGRLVDELSKIKSMLTVNTSPLAQAVIGGELLEHGYSLVAARARETAVYRRNLRLLLEGLARRFGDSGPAAPRITWNSPRGGFFVVLTLPFKVDDDLLEYSARRHGVLWTPMTYFYDGDGGSNQLRLSCSQLTPERIETGLDRLAALVSESVGRSR